MQPPCSFKLGPCGPASSLGSQSSTPILKQLEEKQLFEKFWKGTFKAVATPRPESVIVASITARRRVADSETAACQPLKTDEGKAAAAESRVDAAADRNGCIKTKGRKRHSHRRVRSPSFDEKLSPRPKAKKKKKKSERKRKRKRSPCDSLSPLRKKKKKKKKSSKKSKRHRYSSKKSKHSSSSLKHKRKDERKHKKSSRTHSRRRRRYRRSESESSSCQSSTEDRHHLQKSVVHQALGALAAAGEETNKVLNHTGMKWRPATKSVCKTAPKYRSILSTSTILSSKPGSELLHANGSQPLSSQIEGPHDYDSGNDTSSPPSSKTGVSRASVTDKKNHCQRLASPEKLKFTEKDNASDSGNSVTSYVSLCKPYGEEGLSATLFSGNGKREQITLGCRVDAVRSPKTSSYSQGMSESPRRRLNSRSCSSRSRSRSSGSSRYSRHSRSPSLSSCSSYSRSSYSADLRRRGSMVSLSSRGSYSRHSADRLRDRKRSPGSRETNVKHAHKVSGKRRRRKSYSPLKKRRRDSPSHLEARRITSARKRPIPYFRPSPSSSSRSTSVSSWSSLFTRSRSRSRSLIYSISRSRSRSRSHSYSSYRSYSRSSSWNSIFGTRSRSRSRGSLNKRHKTRR
ncbi:serine/arginine repetitive matrix protein 4 [Anabas testudineus]|uniref:Serine/arginine repetitive matrix protein C-terminal domain-containing protein n=1 Tax=Anabas testudineus TaxID=64144 RepID=A0A3Q1HJW6_ANATE|nr:serine/arginine repetitive matrix protein 4 [Anabas testudineus]